MTACRISPQYYLSDCSVLFLGLALKVVVYALICVLACSRLSPLGYLIEMRGKVRVNSRNKHVTWL